MNIKNHFWDVFLPALAASGTCRGVVVLCQMAVFLYLPVHGFAQSDFKIVACDLNEGLQRIELKVRAIRNGVSEKLSEDALNFTETINGRNKAGVEVDSVRYVVVEDKARMGRREKLNVLFLVRGGGTDIEITQKRLGLMQRIVDALHTGTPDNKFYLSAYGNGAAKPTEIFDVKHLQATLAAYDNRSDTAAVLCRGVIEATRFTREIKGQWAVFVFTDGVNLDPQMPSKQEASYNEADMLYFLRQLAVNVSVFPIGVGTMDGDSLLAEMARATVSKIDTFSINSIPANLKEKIGQRADILYNNIVYLYTKRSVFQGEERLYNAKWIGGPPLFNTASISFHTGTFDEPEKLGNNDTGWQWILKWIFGLVLVAGTLSIFALAIPYFDKRNFFQRYVRRYQKEPNIVRNDPLTGDAIAEGEWVVYKCQRQLCTLATWEYVGNKCAHYPRCLGYSPPCNGAGAPSDTDKFFSGKGTNRRLNWLWFGMLGGFISWTLFALFKYFGMEWYNDLLYPVYQRFGDGHETSRDIDALADNTLLGAAFGTGICFALAWAEERGQPRQLSWARIALRTFFGMLVSLMVFMFGFYLQYKGVMDRGVFASLLTWVLLGMGIGMVLSVESSIAPGRGILGGVVAALLAFGVYWLFSLFGDDFGMAKLISFILMGGLLGFTLLTVFARLEDFELEYISPEAFRQVKPISKWLKNGVDVFIGREQGNYVYVKWEDPAVENYHAQLFYERGGVFIEPMAETFVNGKPLPFKNKTALHNGDLIQLGRESVTRMRYREKRAG